MKKLNFHIILISCILFITSLLATKILANCDEGSLPCLHPEVIKAIKKALIREKSYSGAVNGNWNKKTNNALKKFLKERGIYDKYYKIDCNEEVPGTEDDVRKCFGDLDSHVVEALWGIDFNYSRAGNEERIKFLKQIGITLK